MLTIVCAPQCGANVAALLVAMPCFQCPAPAEV